MRPGDRGEKTAAIARSSRQFTSVVLDTELTLLGGITNLEHFTTAYALARAPRQTPRATRHETPR